MLLCFTRHDGAVSDYVAPTEYSSCDRAAWLVDQFGASRITPGKMMLLLSPLSTHVVLQVHTKRREHLSSLTPPPPLSGAFISSYAVPIFLCQQTLPCVVHYVEYANKRTIFENNSLRPFGTVRQYCCGDRGCKQR